uniref:Uncharacterized protein n=1 Tax=Chrysemys picta bellii TaxID=8478 RepID=A0A8C3F8F1_CHRPI
RPGRLSLWLLAHSIRLLLEYTGTVYEDKMYSCGEGEWCRQGAKLALPSSLSGKHSEGPGMARLCRSSAPSSAETPLF